MIEETSGDYTAEDLANRAELLRSIRGDGLEIGAFHSPIPVGEDARVTYVDLLPPEIQQRYFPEVPEDVPVVTPDLVLPADDLHSIAEGALDFVLASHLLEHIANPVGALVEWHRVLRTGGFLYLVLPDMRHTFDRDRVRTTLDHLVLDAQQDRAHPDRLARDAEHYREWAGIVNSLDDPGQRDFWAGHLVKIQYPIHFHCWQPEDIRDLFHEIDKIGMAHFRICGEAVMKGGYEFVFLLQKV